ncbi:MAG: T9SS type A sorting domain-containing protein [Bacteroidetes bacterium]|nr:T9SS type A sorting domain-containing protein [Bacteroidota bacterium]
MRFLLLICSISDFALSQSISFSPAMQSENSVSLTYYDTEYIFITNEGAETISLSFELIENTLPQEWSVSGCTNIICYPGVPDDGIFGEVSPGGQAYIATNLGTNDVAGSGQIRYRIFDKVHPEINDTLTFVYEAGKETVTEVQPWAKINFSLNVVTVFLENENAGASLRVYDISGKLVLLMKLEAISSVSLINFPEGVYFVEVVAGNGKRIVQKIRVSQL